MRALLVALIAAPPFELHPFPATDPQSKDVGAFEPALIVAFLPVVIGIPERNIFVAGTRTS